VSAAAETRFAPAGAIAGELTVPGDKSISHRAVMVASLCDGEVAVEGFGASADTMATVAAMRALGVEIDQPEPDRLRVHGVGLRGLRAPDERIDVQNAGTLMRLLPGILAGQTGEFVLDGDASIRRRPMARIAEPLAQMGVDLELTDGCPPVRVVASGTVEPISYLLPVASAQVKSCILLAGLFAARGMTVVEEPVPTRDHTERMLREAGAPVDRRPGRVAVSPVATLHLDEVRVPGDFSSAAPFVVAATIVHGSGLTLRGIGINPTRTGLLTVMERMGARVGLFNRRLAAAEPVADIEVRPAELVATEIEAELVPSLIDELPLVALLACFAHGVTTIRGAGELRVKESDRIATVADALNAVGGHVTALDDGFRIRGVPTRLRGGRVEAAGDHRVAMLGAVAGVCSQHGVEVSGSEALGVSFPDFSERLAGVTA
jgi:3-phosphoshikimate 1-carboxyvinyltransferase